MSDVVRPYPKEEIVGQQPPLESVRKETWSRVLSVSVANDALPKPETPSLFDTVQGQIGSAAMGMAVLVMAVAIRKPGLALQLEQKLVLGGRQAAIATEHLATELRGSSALTAAIREATPISSFIDDAVSGLRISREALKSGVSPRVAQAIDGTGLRFGMTQPDSFIFMAQALKPATSVKIAPAAESLPTSLASLAKPVESLSGTVIHTANAADSLPTLLTSLAKPAEPLLAQPPRLQIVRTAESFAPSPVTPASIQVSRLPEQPAAILPAPEAKLPVQAPPVVLERAGTATEKIVPLERLRAAAEPATGPVHGYRFVHIKPDDPVIPHFDVGVGISDRTLLGNAVNLEGKNASDALRTLWWPTAKLPKEGVTLAVERQTPDSFTALAVLANRVEKRKVSEGIVKAVAKSGQDVSDPAHVAAYKAIAHLTQEPGLKLGDRMRGIRSILDGTASTKTIEERALKFDSLNKVVTQGSSEIRTSGVREFKATPQFEYRQPSSAVHQEYDFAIGTRDFKIVGNAKIIDQEGGTGIIERALRMPFNELPKPGASIVMPQTDVSRVTAAAILEARVSNTPIRQPLLDLIQRETRRGSSEFSHSERALQESIERVPANVREEVVGAWRLIEGIASNPLLQARRKVAAVTHLLTHDAPVNRLASVASDYAVFRPSEQPFKYVRTTAYKPKNYDYGVEITDPKLRNGQPNLDHHGAGTTIDTLSASEQAVKLPLDEVPQFGARVAIQKPDADAITAVAVLANRRAGMPVNFRIVDAVGRLDRGFTTDVNGAPFADVETALYAMRSIARNENIPINQRITAARAILSGQARREDIVGIADNYKRNKWMHEVHTEKTSDVTDVIPGRLALIETDKANWFDARKLGTDRAPVAVVAARDAQGTHFEVVVRAGHPDANKLGAALDALSKMEKGWGGRSDIFVSSGSSRLSSEEVLRVISSYLK